MRALSFVSLALLGLTACSFENAIVGGKCRDGFSETNGTCTQSAAPAPSSSPTNGFSDGTPTAPTDEPSNETPDGGLFDRDGGITTSAISIVGTPTTPTTPTNPTNPTNPVNPPLVCDAPLVACHGACIPVANDGDNCGACGKICPSNICIDGECQGAIAGDVIVLGHEYASSWSSSAQAKMIANAVSIPTTDPIRVLAFDGDHPAAAAERSIIASSVRFRGVAYDAANDAALTATDLARKYDVVLIHGAGPKPVDLGKAWAGALDTFTKKGGVVVALDDGSSDLPALMTATGLLSVTGHVTLPAATQVVIDAPNDAVGTQVLSPHAAIGTSIGFFGVGVTSDVTVVARTNDKNAYPTAIHRFVRGQN